MTDTEMLQNIIRQSGYKLKYVTDYLNITYQGFQKKINNITEFKASEIAKLGTLLKLSKTEIELIFFSIK